MKDQRPTTFTRDDLRILLWMAALLLAAAAIDPVTDAIADAITK